MLINRLGLRSKALLVILLGCLFALLPAILIGWQVVDNLRSQLGHAYAQDTNLLSREKLAGPLLRELALARRFADSAVTRQWLLDEQAPAKRELMFLEAEGYRQAFRDHSFFIASNQSLGYYYSDDKIPLSETPFHRLARDNAGDAWYFSTLRNTDDYNINVNYDANVRSTKAWINIVVRDGEQPLGVVGTGLTLTDFLRDFILDRAGGVTPIIIDRNGAIQAHPDTRLIALDTGSGSTTGGGNLLQLLGDDGQRSAMQQAMADAGHDRVGFADVRLDGRPQLLAVSRIPELGWYVVSAVDLHAVPLLETTQLLPLLGIFALVLGLLLVAFLYAMDRLTLAPLKRLQASAEALAGGDYELGLPLDRGDEIGHLSRAFDSMVRQVREHTGLLESRVRERTEALEIANRQMIQAHKKINDSIDYASLIQRAILPERQLALALGEQHFVLWRPRDVVGGDFYIFHGDGDNCLLGIVDCAGHGVPGALMTMLARAAIDHAIAQVGMASPAEVLNRTDAVVRQMLAGSEMPRTLATSMDAALVHVDRAAGRLSFAGAKISLAWSDGERVEEVKGHRRAIGDRRRGEYNDTLVPLQTGCTYYLSTDGLFDQAGGEHGFGFGSRRYLALLREHAGRPVVEQGEALRDALAEHQGTTAQRDDITLLCFRFD